MLSGCGSGDYSETYVIVLNGIEIGREVVIEKKGIKDSLICLSEQVRDMPASEKKGRNTVRTKIVFENGNLFPSSYSYKSDTGLSYDIKAEGDKIIKTLKGDTFTEPLEKGMLILDMTVFTTMDYWFRKYDTDKKGRQLFTTYLLPSGSVQRLSIVPIRTGIHEKESRELELKNYQIGIPDKLDMFLWVDKNKRLARLFIRGLNMDVIRSDLFKLINKNKESEKQTDLIDR